MADDRTLKPRCPKCGGLIVESRGCAMSIAPRDRPPDPFTLQPRPNKVVEYKYRCVDCLEDFSIIEEF